MSKRPEPTDPLSRERSLDGGGGVIEREGLRALSMRRLAQELDVWPMAVYHYFRDKGELLDAVAATTAASVELPTGGASWRDQLASLLRGAHEAGGSLARAFLTPEALGLSEAGLTILVGAGLDKREAASAWRALWSYTYGSATFALAPTSDETRRRTRAAIAGLDDDE